MYIKTKNSAIALLRVYLFWWVLRNLRLLMPTLANLLIYGEPNDTRYARVANPFISNELLIVQKFFFDFMLPFCCCIITFDFGTVLYSTAKFPRWTECNTSMIRAVPIHRYSFTHVRSRVSFLHFFT